jgi:ATP-GRASP peptide maturase of grasp-with-spasm system
MLLIISKEDEITTDKVIEWIKKLNKVVVVRVNEGDKLQIQRINLAPNEAVDIILSFKNKDVINLNKVDFFWFRRGNLLKVLNPNTEVNESLLKFLNSEWKVCLDFIIEELQSVTSLGNYFYARVNKLLNLKVANQCGLNIPSTTITEFCTELSFERPYITKPISETLHIHDELNYLDLFTTKIKGAYDCFYPSLCQEQIIKFFELRVFVSYNDIYAMAIFSQRNQKTKMDYRNYDNDNMNRFVPYALPKHIKERIYSLMNALELDTGSMDFIVTPNREYYFLEVNPAGNIEMISEPCNYYIEKRIAEQINERLPV